MDSLTQIVLGASVGEAIAGRKAGNKAMLWGAIAGTIPDLDVLANYFMDDVHAMNVHRGVMHSVLFAVLFSPLLGKCLNILYKKTGVSFYQWTAVFFMGFVTHALLDSFTTWGTQLFWPFDYRIAWQTIFVIDPLYTLPFLTLVILAMLKPKGSAIRIKLNNYALIISCLYLGLTVVNKMRVNHVFETALAQKGIEVKSYSTRPAPLNNILWSMNAAVDSGFVIAHYSFFDNAIPDTFLFVPQNEKLLEPLVNNDEISILKKITKNYYSIEKKGDTLYMHDLRFGQLGAYRKGDAPFVFTYQISPTADGYEISQLKNTFKKGEGMLEELWNRIIDKQ